MAQRALAEISGFVNWVRRRDPDSSWPLDQSVFRPPLDSGQPSKWVTLDALRLLKAFVL